MNKQFLKWVLETALHNMILKCNECPVKKECFQSGKLICGLTLKELDEPSK